MIHRIHSRYLLLLIFLLISSPCGAEWVYESEAIFKVKATPKVVNEGDIVKFEVYDQSYRDKDLKKNFRVPAHVSYLEWDFGGGLRDSALGLNKITHRFIDGKNEPQTVRVAHLNTEKTVTVEVKNVKPQIYRMWHSTPVLKGQPVKFHALATDPGLIDVLTFSWDFGDGSTATGAHVEHTFNGTGDYQVTLKVDDGIEFDIRAMDVDIASSNTFVVSGGVSLPRMEIDQLVLAASTAQPMAQNPTGECQIRLQMGNRERNTAIILTANLDPGFKPGKYAIGEGNEWDGSHQDEVAAKGTFFADLGLDRSIAIRDFSGKAVGGPFWSEEGEVTIHKFDGDQLELSFWVNLLEIIPVDFGPRQVRVEGHLATRVETSQSGVLKGIGDVFSSAFQDMDDPDAPSTFEGANFYLCGREQPGTFDIASWSPENNDVGVPYQQSQVEVTFTEQVDPETLVDNAHLEMRTRVGFRKIPGDWEVRPDDPKTIRFVPKAYLLPAVVYCVRIDANEDGLRSAKGDVLVGTGSHGFSKAMKPACDNKDSSSYGSNTRRAAFSTRVEFTHSRVDVYQSSLVTGDTDLVSGKPSLARVFAHWPDFGLVHPSAFVKEIEAKVSLSGTASIPSQPMEVKIKQTDRYTKLQRRSAQNSVNFHGWRPGKGGGETRVHTVIEQLDRNGVKIEPGYIGEDTVLRTWPHEGDFKKLTVQPFLVQYQGDCTGLSVQDCDWLNGVSDYWRNKAQVKLAEALEFTTQNFPFATTVTTDIQAGIPTIQFTAPGPAAECSLEGLDGFNCYNVGSDTETSVDEYVGDLLFDAAGDTSADILLGIVPPGFFVPGSVIGLQTWDSQDRPLVYAQLDEANAATITHEFGHFFGLDHCPPGDDDDPCMINPVQGYRLNPSGQSGYNKHQLDGNQQANELGQLMHPSERPVDNQFITVSQYRNVMTGIHDFRKTNPIDTATVSPVSESSWLAALLLPASAHAASRDDPAGQQLVVSGTVRNGEIHINRIRTIPAALREDTPPSKGPYTLELRNADGMLLQSDSFDLRKSPSWHGQTFHTSGFRLSVTAPDNTGAIVLSGPGGAQATANASESKPEVAARLTTDPNSALRTLQWTASDADGDALTSSVYLKGDDGEWYGVAADFTGTRLEIPGVNLPAAQSTTARIIVSDGFNSASTEIDLGAGAPLSVLAAFPPNGATQADLMPGIRAYLSNPLQLKDAGTGLVDLPAGQLTLSDSSGAEVPGSASYLVATRSLALTPANPLEPDSQYRVTLQGLRDRWNNTLSKPYSWSFRTGPREPDPEAKQDPDEWLPKHADFSDIPVLGSTASPIESPSDKTRPAKQKPPQSNSSSKPGQGDSWGDCSCECDQRAAADDLCQLFCEDEFAACENS